MAVVHCMCSRKSGAPAEPEPGHAPQAPPERAPSGPSLAPGQPNAGARVEASASRAWSLPARTMSQQTVRKIPRDPVGIGLEAAHIRGIVGGDQECADAALRLALCCDLPKIIQVIPMIFQNSEKNPTVTGPFQPGGLQADQGIPTLFCLYLSTVRCKSKSTLFSMPFESGSSVCTKRESVHGKASKNPKALLYCSVWPDEGHELSLESQSVELQTYCLMNGLEVVDILSDVGPHVKGRLRARHGTPAFKGHAGRHRPHRHP